MQVFNVSKLSQDLHSLPPNQPQRPTSERCSPVADPRSMQYVCTFPAEKPIEARTNSVMYDLCWGLESDRGKNGPAFGFAPSAAPF